MMKLEYDQEADAVYIKVRRRRHHHSKEIDDTRFIDYSADGCLVGIELLYVSGGVDTQGLPHRKELEALLTAKGFKVV